MLINFLFNHAPPHTRLNNNGLKSLHIGTYICIDSMEKTEESRSAPLLLPFTTLKTITVGGNFVRMHSNPGRWYSNEFYVNPYGTVVVCLDSLPTDDGLKSAPKLTLEYFCVTKV
ncbi:hypothetical protein ACTXT7_002863 [Hymenolepis weldensis]